MKAREFTLMWIEDIPARGWKFISYMCGSKLDDGKFVHVIEKLPLTISDEQAAKKYCDQVPCNGVCDCNIFLAGIEHERNKGGK